MTPSRKVISLILALAMFSITTTVAFVPTAAYACFSYCR